MGGCLSGGIAPALLLEPGFARPLERRELAEAEAFYRDFYAGGQPFPWPRAMFERILSEHDGYLSALRDGLVRRPGPLRRRTVSANLDRRCRLRRVRRLDRKHAAPLPLEFFDPAPPAAAAAKSG